MQKNQIDSSIKDLTPTCPLEKTLYDMDIIGYDILDETHHPLQSEEFVFIPGSPFYVNIYAKKRLVNLASPKDTQLYDFVGIWDHESIGDFHSTLVNAYSGQEEVSLIPDKWPIGGIFKLKFHFKVPETALPGQYTLKIKKRNPIYLKADIHIDIIGYDVLDEENNRLPLKELSFSQGSPFYVNIYGKERIKKIANAIVSEKMGPHYYQAVLKHDNGSFFGSTASYALPQEKEGSIRPELEEISGIQKIQYHFQIPESVQPGFYNLRIVQEKSIYLETDISIRIDSFGYDILNEAHASLSPGELAIFQGEKFYLNLYGQGKIKTIADAIDNEYQGPHHYQAVLKRKDGVHLGSTTSSVLPIRPEDKYSGKVQYNFMIPRSAGPGFYSLNIIRGKSIYLKTNIKIEVIGYEFLNEAHKPIDSDEFTFSQERKFYLNLYGQEKIKTIADAIKNEQLGPYHYNVVFKHESGSYFKSTLSEVLPEENGTTKIKFHFKIPEDIPLGNYNLRIVKAGPIYLNSNIYIYIINN